MLFQGSKDQRFFEILRAAAENTVEAANLLSQLLSEPARYAELGPPIKELEKKGDDLTHDLFSLINKTFVTPLEREDLADLGKAIDSVVDGMEAAAARIAIYRINESDRFLKEFGNILRAQCAELVNTIDLVAGNRLMRIHDHTAKLNTLENQADENLRAGLSFQFAQAAGDPVRFIVMKEIYEVLEGATDRAEDVANTLEGVVMKHA